MTKKSLENIQNFSGFCSPPFSQELFSLDLRKIVKIGNKRLGSDIDWNAPTNNIKGKYVGGFREMG
jgi:hypothetical protein